MVKIRSGGVCEDPRRTIASIASRYCSPKSMVFVQFPTTAKHDLEAMGDRTILEQIFGVEDHSGALMRGSPSVRRCPLVSCCCQT